MYQFYYSDQTAERPAKYRQKISDVFSVTAVRPAMWEEHCLECSAPLCFRTCPHYTARRDGRCRRLENGYSVRPQAEGVCGEAARVKFRPWGNMMTIVFPAMLPPEEYAALHRENRHLGERLHSVVNGPLPVKARWGIIRVREYLRRKSLRGLHGLDNRPDAFVFHGYSFEKEPFRLILEVYDDHTPKFKTSLSLEPGENLIIIDKSKLSEACWTENYLVKLYPENDREAELDILWADFVQGCPAASEKPADKVKCLVWDLDNTVWDGILIETENSDSLTLLPGVAETMERMDARGILQSIASKNDFDQAWPVLERLGISRYFLYPQIHWNAKSGSMRQIAEKLNIGLDTLALVDDSSFERQQVQTMCPQVRTYDAAELSALLEREEFRVPATEESRHRREMYQAEERRNRQMELDNSDTLAFLRKCHLRAELFTPETEAEKLRCYELLVRTNQLNMSGRKYTPEEFAGVLASPDHKCAAFSCEDDYGTYGIVGFVQYRTEKDTLEITEFAMSCRVAGKYVESALFAALLEQESCRIGQMTVKKTKKNGLLRRTLDEIGFRTTYENEITVEYSFTSELRENGLVAVKIRFLR